MGEFCCLSPDTNSITRAGGLDRLTAGLRPLCGRVLLSPDTNSITRAGGLDCLLLEGGDFEYRNRSLEHVAEHHRGFVADSD